MKRITLVLLGLLPLPFGYLLYALGRGGFYPPTLLAGAITIGMFAFWFYAGFISIRFVGTRKAAVLYQNAPAIVFLLLFVCTVHLAEGGGLIHALAHRYYYIPLFYVMYVPGMYSLLESVMGLRVLAGIICTVLVIISCCGRAAGERRLKNRESIAAERQNHCQRDKKERTDGLEMMKKGMLLLLGFLPVPLGYLVDVLSGGGFDPPVFPTIFLHAGILVVWFLIGMLSVKLTAARKAAVLYLNTPAILFLCIFLFTIFSVEVENSILVLPSRYFYTPFFYILDIVETKSFGALFALYDMVLFFSCALLLTSSYFGRVVGEGRQRNKSGGMEERQNQCRSEIQGGSIWIAGMKKGFVLLAGFAPLLLGDWMSSLPWGRIRISAVFGFAAYLCILTVWFFIGKASIKLVNTRLGAVALQNAPALLFLIRALFASLESTVEDSAIMAEYFYIPFIQLGSSFGTRYYMQHPWVASIVTCGLFMLLSFCGRVAGERRWSKIK